MTPEERERYSRQILFPPIGEVGQDKLLSSHVAIIGCGALGTFQAAALSRAGVGKLTIIDRDYVEPSNLQRQWLFEERDAKENLPKAVAAARAIGRISSSTQVIPHVTDLTPTTIEDLLREADLLLDATDNFETRYLLNEFALSTKKPWVYGAAVGSYGISMPVLPGVSSCLQCVYPEPPKSGQPTCETAGVLGSVTATIAAIQTADAMRILVGDYPRFRITTIDVWSGSVRQIDQPPRDPACRACGPDPEFPYMNGERSAPISLCGRDAVQIHERARPLDLVELEERLAKLAPVRSNEFALRFFPSPFEMTIFPDGRAIIKGTTDVGVARSLYAKYIGA
ncbi:MAG: ThiF family adenylyltransferase [Acidobacteria bacterium]|nr:ThiF family adenylyltransferase [Acidobacteriota bacterium]